MKQKYLIIDTETANTIEQPLVYDIGYAICDNSGKVYKKRSFVVAEIFLDFKNTELMNSVYYAEKIPQYWKDIQNKQRTIKSIFNIRKQIKADIKKYKVKKIGAYNMAFDRRALNNTIRYCSKSLIRWFFPYSTKYFCVWNMACQTLLNTASYIKFAQANNLLNPSGNIQTNAEACYKYITNKTDFSESHTGLEDVLIEIEIFAKCYKTHKKMNTDINYNCWRLPQYKRKELELREVFK